MIPRAITVRGFLCYRDAQTIDFNDSDLWVLAGRNGSGKSALFDAVTFALFKAHRGGQRDVSSLIHAGSDELEVLFEFGLGEECYRIRRTVTRNGGSTRGVFHREVDPDGNTRWPAVAETQNDQQMTAWVSDHVGLTYETFTASVLLLQGQADRLLTTKGADRYAILAGIVDLSRYERLHEQARAEARQADAQVKALASQIQAFTPLSPEVQNAAEAAVSAARERRSAAAAERDGMVRRMAQAERWAEWSRDEARARRDRDEAQALLQHADAIRRDALRLGELNDVLPGLRQIFRDRQTIDRLDGEIRKTTHEQQSIAEALRTLDQQIAAQQVRLDELSSLIETTNARRFDVANRLSVLAPAKARADQARRVCEQIETLTREIAAFPEDLEDCLSRLQADLDQALAWSQALPSLRQGRTATDGMIQARLASRAAAQAIESAASALGAARGQLDDARRSESTCRDNEARVRNEEGRTAGLAERAKERLESFVTLQGAASCDRCGQALTPSHYEAEHGRLHIEAEQAARAHQAATAALAQSHAQHEAARQAIASAQTRVQEATSRLQERERQQQQAGEAATQHARAWQDAYNALPESFQARVSPHPADDLATIGFPTEHDLNEGQRLVDAIPAIQRQLRAEGDRAADLIARRALLNDQRQQWERLGLQPDDAQAEAESARLDAEQASLQERQEQQETERREIQATSQAWQIQAEPLRRQQEALAAAMASQHTERGIAVGQRQRQREALPASWQHLVDDLNPDQLAAWEREQRALCDRETAERMAALPLAQQRFDTATEELDRVSARIAALPEEARCEPQALERPIAEANRRYDGAEAALQQGIDALKQIQHSMALREQLCGQRRQAEEQERIAQRLAELLGRKGLQGALIREAEQGIVERANPILRDISNGELSLELKTPENPEAEALLLDAIERVQGRSGRRSVNYLSGSQRFRVAVSLALAIGQYARGSRRQPIQSVIIDEGFGSLDRDGRDAMIAELNALRGRLARIILVSHQDEFASAFRDGYRLSVVDGSTVVERFHG